MDNARSGSAAPQTPIGPSQSLASLTLAPDDDNERQSNRSTFVMRVGIWLAPFNPLVALRCAMVEAHAPPDREGSASKRPSPWLAQQKMMDLRATTNSDCGHDFAPQRRDELLIANLPVVIQLAFRCNILRLAVMQFCAFVATLAVASVAFPLATWYEVMQANGHMYAIAVGSAISATIMSMGLLYSVRFDAPVNIGVWCFLQLCEMALALLVAMRLPSNATLMLCCLSCGAILLTCGFSTRKRHVQPNGDFSLMSPAKASVCSCAILSCFAITSFYAIEERKNSVSASTFSLMVVAAMAHTLWIGLTTSWMLQSMAPDEHTSSMFFYQTDAVVVVLVCARSVGRCLRRLTQPCRRTGSVVKAEEDAVAASKASTKDDAPSVAVSIPVTSDTEEEEDAVVVTIESPMARRRSMTVEV